MIRNSRRRRRMGMALPTGARFRLLAGHHGFSLIELLVVLLLLSIITASIGGLFAAGLSGGEARAAAYRAAVALRQARTRALVEGRPCAVAFDLDARSISVDDRVTGSWPSDVEVALRTARTELHGGRIGAIRFFPDGSATGGRLVLDHDGRVWSITVSWLTGGIALHEGT